jgi:hypothetical protein
MTEQRKHSVNTQCIHLAIKKNKILSFVAIWMSLEETALKETRKTNTACSDLCGNQKHWSHRSRN